jgi:aryl-alcohol dehydrogenase-like predicted oxidoreductase
LGTWRWGGDYWQAGEEGEAKKVISLALELGIRDFDTAPAYGRGRAEQLLGQALRGKGEAVRVSTKFYPTLAENVEKTLRRSLNRLLRDSVETLYIHWPNPRYPLAKIMESLEAVREKGLIRRVGVSNFSPEDLREALRWGRIDDCQCPYSLLWRLPEGEIFPLCREAGIPLSVYSPLAQGYLTGPPGNYADGRRKLWLSRPEIRAALLEFWEDFHRAAALGEGISFAQAALAWLLAPGRGLGVVYTGAKNREQLKQNAGASGLTLPPALGTALEEISSRFARRFRQTFPQAQNMWERHQ